MDNGRLLLQAIKSHPRERVPRLIYADWLEENGQPERAQFIRLNTTQEMTTNNTERAVSARQANQIEKKYKSFWCQPGLNPKDVEYRDGMPFLHIEADRFLRDIETILVNHPDIIGVNIINDLLEANLTEQAARSPLLANFNQLAFSGFYRPTDELIGVLVQNPALAQVTHLSFPFPEISDAGAQAIAQCHYLSVLTSLTIMRRRALTPEGFVALSSGIYSDSLEHLSYSMCYLSDNHIRAIAEDGPKLPNLKTLDLSLSWSTRTGLVSIASSTRLPSSTTLEISGINGLRFTGTIEDLRTALASRWRFGGENYRN
ncbi:Repeat-companion domain TIGR02996 OS=Singulisphaera acidiphila (strain ATCC BAA-1392 / DSM 18658 / VKM B-2454 / MOB10) GN=Sinac_4455 PE=4 SV=1 [Gemmata massiliana]|uniref:Repeat-companion domain TIGR02996 n=2 Tax=Gemmata massiliana TaxID=1210884 RepID=A0A6P2CRU8_9BACT|nr:Repeat-companion domain TIGR02996 OS=Singulisphaera acidiphila (strain ATCC BAA-1392 / DSM 18658 / VKM B-2454 / MOB10) GN=Sinac_4455 PE=4 SV=1 [Gemmata massiliana]